MQPLTYTYNTQVHRKTNNSPNSLVCSQHTPGPSLLSATVDKMLSATDNHSTQSMQKLQRKRIVALRTKLDSDIRKSQCTYKLDYDRCIREIFYFRTVSSDLLDNPTLRRVSDSSAEDMAKYTYNKLQGRTRRPVRIVSVQKSSATIENNWNPHTISINRVAHARTSPSREPDQLHNSANQQSVLTPRKKKDEEDTVSDNEYVVEK